MQCWSDFYDLACAVLQPNIACGPYSTTNRSTAQEICADCETCTAEALPAQLVSTNSNQAMILMAHMIETLTRAGDGV